MFVGDFRQLPPIAQSKSSQKILQTDVFSFLKIIDERGNMYAHPWLVMLDEQRRMHPDISGFSSKFIYKNLLKDHESVLHKHDQIVKSLPLANDAMNLIDLSGAYCASDKNRDNSRFNIMSAVISFCTAVSAQVEGKQDSVGIITPYAAQTRLIRAMMKDYYKHGTKVVSCATVHQFQGSESNVIIFDSVESYPSPKVGFLLGKDMDNVMRLINVAITRARGKFITIANANFWTNTFGGTNHIYYRLLEYIRSGHTVIGKKGEYQKLSEYLNQIKMPKMIRMYEQEEQAIEIFLQDIEKAEGKIVVSLPSGMLSEYSSQVIEIINKAYRKGITVLMKSNDYSHLPTPWKDYCVGTENAVFPLIVIDDTIVWYGLPSANYSFQVSKTTKQHSVLHPIFRIKGHNTTDMIVSLTDLEMVSTSSGIRPLVQKMGSKVRTTGGDKSKGDIEIIPTGLAGFVEEKQYCPDCKSHMVLTKNARGVSYLKCSGKDCKHKEYLTKDIIDWYISVKNVSCPKDGGDLYGGVGKYGPYVKCSCDHYLKPFEI